MRGVPAETATRRPARERLADGAIDGFLLLFGAAMLLPLALLVANGFKSPQELLQWPPTILPAQASQPPRP